MNKITINEDGTADGFEIEVKRFYLPFTIHSCCPACGLADECDLQAEQYLSYPAIGTPESVGFYCSECDHEWEVNVKLGITLELV